MVRAHLAAVHRIDLAHLLLDEGVAGFAQHRLAAVLLHDLDRVPGQARIVHDARAVMAAQERLGQQADQIVALDEAALLVEEEAAIVVPVPGESEVGAGARIASMVLARFSSSIGLGTPFGKRTVGLDSRS